MSSVQGESINLAKTFSYGQRDDYGKRIHSLEPNILPTTAGLIQNNILPSNSPPDSPFELKVSPLLWHNIFYMLAKLNSDVSIFWLSY